MHTVFGDSLVNPTGQTVVGFVSMLNAQLGVTFDNRAHSGDQVSDQLKQIYTINPGAGDVSLLAVGINDMRQYSKNSVSQGRAYYRDGLAAAIAWLALANKQTARASTVFKSGTSWVNAQTFNIGLRATTVGDYLIFTVQGNVLYLAMQLADPAGLNGTYSVSIDGGTPMNFDSSAPGITSVNGFPYSDRLHRFPVGGSITDTHTIKVTMTGLSYVYVEWAAGNYQAAFPTVCIGNITRLSNVTGVANFGYYGWGGSDAIVSAWNGDTYSTIGNAISDGLDVRPVNTFGAVNNDTDLSGVDGLHWLQSGQLSAFGAFSPTLAALSLTSVSTYRRSDGLYFIDDGAARVRLLTSP